MDRNLLTSTEPAIYPEAFFFDLDGTLLDSERYWLQAEEMVLKRHNGRWSDDLPQQLQGNSLNFCANLFQERGVTLSAEEIIQELTDLVMEMEKACLPWVPGVQELLQEIAASHIPAVLVTASPRWMAENLIAHAPEHAFIGYVCGDEDLPHKPSPEPYLHAAKLAQVTHLDHCITFEDSYPGITAGLAAGTETIAVSGYSRMDVYESDLPVKAIPDFRGITIERLAEHLTATLA